MELNGVELNGVEPNGIEWRQIESDGVVEMNGDGGK